ncbi:MAG: ABC transporter permease [Candidatus Eiseniibacteriota bacterium]
MEFRESARIALGALRANKLRSFLTLLGTIVGVTAVISIISLIQGMNQYVSDKLLSQGANVFWVDKYGFILSDDEFREANKRKDLVLDDAEAVAALTRHAAAVKAESERRADIRFGQQRERRVPIKGVWGDYVGVDKIELEDGRHLTPNDLARRRTVAVLGYEIWEKVFRGEPAVGHDIRIGDQKFTVVGVATKKGSVFGQSQDNFVLIPLGTFYKLYGSRGSISIGVASVDQASFELAQDEVRAVLRARRHVDPGKPDDFGIVTAEMFMDLYRNFTTAAFVVLVGVAGISLVVGGIVIMNIMMVSVTERTREIGIRKAIGAKRSDVLMQFLVEAATLSLAGGAIGVLLGIGLALLVAAISPLPAAVSWIAIFLGLAMSTGIGLVFGIYPAARAAGLDPIVALRYE